MILERNEQDVKELVVARKEGVLEGTEAVAPDELVELTLLHPVEVCGAIFVDEPPAVRVLVEKLDNQRELGLVDVVDDAGWADLQGSLEPELTVKEKRVSENAWYLRCSTVGRAFEGPVDGQGSSEVRPELSVEVLHLIGGLLDHRAPFGVDI